MPARILLVALALVSVLLPAAAAAGTSSTPRACTGAELERHFSLEGEAAHLVGGIALRNTSDAACLLPSWPRAELEWHGAALRLYETRYAYQPDPEQRPVASLGPHRWAFAAILWSNWCRPSPWGTGSASPTLRLALLRGSVTIAMRHPSRIDSAGPPPMHFQQRGVAAPEMAGAAHERPVPAGARAAKREPRRLSPKGSRAPAKRCERAGRRRRRRQKEGQAPYGGLALSGS
jgi:hypothetical protein